MPDVPVNAVHDEREWVLWQHPSLGSPGVHHGPTLQSDIETVVPKSVLEAERQAREEAEKLLHKYILDGEGATDEVMTLEAERDRYKEALELIAEHARRATRRERGGAKTVQGDALFLIGQKARFALHPGQRETGMSDVLSEHERPVVFEAIRGSEGVCLALTVRDGFSTRIAGPKPWGGGTVMHRWEVNPSELRQELRAPPDATRWLSEAPPEAAVPSPAEVEAAAKAIYDAEGKPCGRYENDVRRKGIRTYRFCDWDELAEVDKAGPRKHARAALAAARAATQEDA